MRNKKTAFTLAAVLLLVCALAGCGGSKAAGKESTASAAPAASETQTAVQTETGAPAQQSTSAEDTEPAMAEGADSDWYMKALTDAALLAEYPYHHFEDINGNGVPLLFLSSTEKAFIGSEDSACLFVYAAGEPEMVLEIGGAGGEKFYCSSAEKTVTVFSRLSGESHIAVYRVRNGALEKVTDADVYSPHHYPEADNAETVYLQDGEEITEEESGALWKKYASDSDEISYEKTES